VNLSFTNGMKMNKNKCQILHVGQSHSRYRTGSGVLVNTRLNVTFHLLLCQSRRSCKGTLITRRVNAQTC